ncbi:hypothetical protein HWV62_30382 [Athelia sp. TMB]|nr:hypothetical protein HWV62_30382 [Athelia sp. TMB]
MDISEALKSSQSFVRALKAPSDPPQKDGPSKIEIALDAWSDQSFYVPNKGEVISEWILTKLLKDKSKQSANPILDTRYWTLLGAIIALPDRTSSKEVHTRPTKTWLTPLLNRTPICPTLLSFLASYQGVPLENRHPLSSAVHQCMIVLWPLSVHKVGVEALLELFGTFLKACESARDDLEKFGETITTSFRNALSNSSNKRKIYQSFTQNHLVPWLTYLHRFSESTTPSQAKENVYAAGAEILFGIDILRPLQTQNSLASASLPPLEPLLSTHPLCVLSILPRLMYSFVHTIRKQRGALFAGGSNGGIHALVEVRRTGMGFFGSCLGLLDILNEVETIWETKVKLLQIVDTENLFVDGGADADGELLLKSTSDGALEALAGGSTTCAIRALSVLTRIDYDLVDPAKIFSRLLLTPAESESLNLLTLLLDYHTKTRTIPTYINTLLSSLSPPLQDLSLKTYTEIYASSSSGPLLSRPHLTLLAKHTHTYLTPGQLAPLAQTAFDAISGIWNAFLIANEKTQGKKKKRKIDVAEKKGDADADELAIQLSLTCRIIGTVIPSLPLHSLPNSSRQNVHDNLTSISSELIRPSIAILLAFIKEQSGRRGDGWAAQVSAAALMRFDYALMGLRPLSLGKHMQRPSVQRMLDFVEAEEASISPELILEILRTLLSHLQDSVLSSGTDSPSMRTAEIALTYLEHHFSVSAAWGGLSSQLTSEVTGRAEAALALLHLLLDRWLPVFDLLASRAQLERLASLMIIAQLDHEGLPPPAGKLHSRSTFATTLHSAQFWELSNMRAALLTCISRHIAFIDELDVQKLQSRKSKKVEMETEKQRTVIAVYELLLLFPTEYFPRVSRQDFLRRAVIADVALSKTQSGNTEDQNWALRTLRTFQKRWFSYQSASDHKAMQESAKHLVKSLGPEAPADSLTSVTLELIELHIASLMRSPEEGAAAAVLDIISALSATLAGQDIPLAVLRFMELIPSDFSKSHFPESILSSMSQLHDQVLAIISPQALAFIESEDFENISIKSHLLHVCCAVLSFGRWLSKNTVLAPIGKPIAVKIVSSLRSTSTPSHNGSEQLAVGAFAVLLEEFWNCPEDSRSPHLDLSVATYISLSAHVAAAVWIKELDVLFLKTSKALPVSEFSGLLDFCQDSLAGEGLSPQDLACVVHLSTLLLSEAPQGTLKVIQAFTTGCFNLFAGNSFFYSGPLPLRSEVLNFTAQHCSDRPAALRSQDLGSIWSLISKSLCGSQTHDPESSPSTFHSLISITSAVIRLRRDLVVCTLPHLGMVLRQLISVIRHLRPQLGSKQSKLVTDDLPVWINATQQPLGAEEGKALARLLTTLTTKSMTRTHHHHGESTSQIQKAESLAKPFSKHAAYVLKAYIDAMNDPLCVLPLDLRRELQPGLYAVCDMLNEHSRDAMMVSALDAGGKTTMKALWKEYEKQKYVGKG